jgi:hypothetical protein
MPADLLLSLPLSHDDRRAAIDAMASGRAMWVAIGQCSLHVDLEQGHIWGVDCYGQDRIAANADDHAGDDLLDFFARALDWAIAEHARPLGDHPAERNYDFIR